MQWINLGLPGAGRGNSLPQPGELFINHNCGFSLSKEKVIIVHISSALYEPQIFRMSMELKLNYYWL